MLKAISEYVVPQILLSCSMALVTLGSPIKCIAQTQAPDGTASAQLHYNNAVSAIAKNDWATAKSELIRARKLAPRNALVSFDLALAYEHTGQTEAARTELNHALELGLPPEQKKAAERMEEQLAKSSPTQSTQNSPVPAVARPARPIEEITEWIVANGQWVASYNHPTSLPGGITAEVIGNEVAQITNEPCSLAITSRRDRTTSFGESEIVEQLEFRHGVNLAVIDPTNISVKVLEDDIPGSTEIVLHSTNNNPSIRGSLTYIDKRRSNSSQPYKISGPQDQPETDNEVQVWTGTAAMGDRLLNAFKDAVTACGGKPSVGQIY